MKRERPIGISPEVLVLGAERIALEVVGVEEMLASGAAPIPPVKVSRRVADR